MNKRSTTEYLSIRSSPATRISAILPIVMSVTALAMVLVHYATIGITHETDEGTLAHLFQLLIVGQLPFIAYYAVVQLPQSAAHTVKMLAIQGAAAAAALVAARALT